MQKDIPQSVDPDEPKTPGRAIFSGAHDYFVNNVLPDTIQAHVSHYQTPTSYANNRDQTFMVCSFVRLILSAPAREKH